MKINLQLTSNAQTIMGFIEWWSTNFKTNIRSKIKSILLRAAYEILLEIYFHPK